MTVTLARDPDSSSTTLNKAEWTEETTEWLKKFNDNNNKLNKDNESSDKFWNGFRSGLTGSKMPTDKEVFDPTNMIRRCLYENDEIMVTHCFATIDGAPPPPPPPPRASLPPLSIPTTPSASHGTALFARESLV